MERYAIYFAPEPDSPLSEFGKGWLLRDENANSRRPLSAINGWQDHPGLVTVPARYGFHATLKAPFRPRPDVTLKQLSAALSDLVQDYPEVEAAPLGLARIGNFLALCPGSRPGASGNIDKLAGACIKLFEPFRAPLTKTDLERRNTTTLTDRQMANLNQWGYPHVFEDFRFHITLTGPLAEPVLADTQSRLHPLVEPFARDAFVIRSVCLFGDPGEGRPFQLIERFALQSQ